MTTAARKEAGRATWSLVHKRVNLRWRRLFDTGGPGPLPGPAPAMRPADLSKLAGHGRLLKAVRVRLRAACRAAAEGAGPPL